MAMDAALGFDGRCDATIAAIFDGDAAAASAKLSALLSALGVQLDLSRYGLDAASWRNVIGSLERFRFTCGDAFLDPIDKKPEHTAICSGQML